MACFETYLSTDAINTLLCCSVCMDSGHKSFQNTKLFMDNFGHWSKAVGGARSIANNKCKKEMNMKVFSFEEFYKNSFWILISNWIKVKSFSSQMKIKLLWKIFLKSWTILSNTILENLSGGNLTYVKILSYCYLFEVIC